MNQSHKNRLLAQFGARSIIEALEPMISQERQTRIQSVLAGRLSSIHLAIEQPCDINNALAAIRSAEAMGIAQVHLIAPQADARLTQSITRGAVYWVDLSFYDDLNEFLVRARTLSLRLAAATPRASQVLAELPIDGPLCIMIGNEQRGLSKEAESAADLAYKIPMQGMSESFNLSVSAAISLYDLTQRKRASLGGQSDLTEAMHKDLLAAYYLNSTTLRIAEGVLRRR
jgi:tRNA (guanosine-2'-O-)-methyltransferase